MNLLFSFLVALSSACLVHAEWVVQTGTQTSICVGVGAGATAVGIAATTSQTDPTTAPKALIDLYSKGVWNTTQVESSSGLLLDAAISKDSALKVASSLFPVYVSNASGAEYVQVEGLGGSIQSANIFGNTNIGLVGGIVLNKRSYSGAAVSLDKGNTWKAYDIPSGYARYGAFVDEKTWFISAGIWNDDEVTVDSAVYLTTTKEAPMKPLARRIRFRQELDPRADGNTLASPNANGWLASVSRTLDGGKTWTEVFHNVEGSAYYFNGISCSSATHCAVVGEGEDTTGGDLTLVLTTTDGGSTWAESFNSTEVASVTAVKLIDAKVGWFVGMVKKRLTMEGQFYTTVDGGVTWKLAQTLPDCYPMDLDMSDDGTTGITTCLSSSGSSATIALYTA